MLGIAMLRNTNIATQVMIAFTVIMLLVVSLGFFSWGRLNSMGDAFVQAESGRQMAISAADLGKEVAESSLLFGQYVESVHLTDGEETVEAMEDVRRESTALLAMGIESASEMVILKERHIEELKNFINSHDRRGVLKETVTSLGIKNRRELGRLVEMLEVRGFDTAAFHALRASESFLVARVRIDRFIGGMPVSELDTATAPYEATCSIPDDHIDPRRSALFMARSILREVRDGDARC